MHARRNLHAASGTTGHPDRDSGTVMSMQPRQLAIAVVEQLQDSLQPVVSRTVVEGLPQTEDWASVLIRARPSTPASAPLTMHFAAGETIITFGHAGREELVPEQWFDEIDVRRFVAAVLAAVIQGNYDEVLYLRRGRVVASEGELLVDRTHPRRYVAKSWPWLTWGTKAVVLDYAPY
jgi:hypothetical protein